MTNLLHLQEIIGYQFQDSALLTQALTHRSHGRINNERLEFLGDSLLNNIIARYLFNNYPDAGEGVLSRLRASMVRNETLSRISESLDLPSHLLVGQSLLNGSFRSPSIISDTFEAIIGAIYLDAGWEETEKFVFSQFQDELNNNRPTGLRDSKTALQEWLQNRHYSLPEYHITKVEGPGHQRMFSVNCRLNDHEKIEGFPIQGTSGSGSNRRLAEQQSAQRALAIIEKAVNTSRSEVN